MAKEFKLKDVGATVDLKLGEKKEVEVEGIEDAKVLLVNAGGTVQAIGPKCTHYGAPLVKGVLMKSGRLTCPWHGGRRLECVQAKSILSLPFTYVVSFPACFNAKTGDVEDAPALDSLPTFKLSHHDGATYITGDADLIKAGRRQPSIKPRASSKSQASDRVVIVGGGSGSVGAIESLRENGFAGSITVVTNEGYLPIDRTKLSKALLTDLNKLQWRDEGFYKSGEVHIVYDEVVDADFAKRSVRTKKGESIAYNKLILATGGSPKTLPLQGFKVLGNVFTLRQVPDAKKIVDAIGEKKGKKIVVIGSSFIGMEVAVATASDNEVTVVGMENVPLERVLGDKVGKLVQKQVEDKGVKFYMGASVDKAEPSTKDASLVGSVHLKDGTKLEADIVILGVGVAPATAFLKNNPAVKLEEDGSLKTDDSFAVVGLEDVYAIGDIATFPYHGPGGKPGSSVRIEHWNVAQNAGRVVARHIVQPSTPAERFTPIFWSAVGAQLRYCGNTVGGFDDVVLKGEPDEGKWAAYYTQNDVVVAVASVGMDPIMSKSAELMRLRKMPGKKDLQGGVDVLSLDAPE
jgi:NADPH-dependent 2,4-dienoyl-CoA reductase/sulfur reductase-like enzyme/nitrite reductase/ring-hydroxylating ferredoxin subunit